MRPQMSKYLSRNPKAMMKFCVTGKYPATLSTLAHSPLISLLESLTAQDRLMILGVRVDAKLGYGGSRVFPNAQQALNWVKPPNAVVHWPAESYRLKSFNKSLSLTDLNANSASWPSHITR